MATGGTFAGERQLVDGSGNALGAVGNPLYFQSLGPAVDAVNNLGTKTTAATLVIDSLNILTLTNANTCVLTLPTPVQGHKIKLGAYQAATTGNALITWPAATKVAGSSKPTMTTGGGAHDYYELECVDGTTWEFSNIQAAVA
jgi:hypothetical protein